MTYLCLGINGFAGDRTPQAMLECHPFTQALASHINAPFELYGQSHPARDLPWDQALTASAETFSCVSTELEKAFDNGNTPILVTPRCASAIASLPIVVSQCSDVMVIYFDAHGDLNIPSTSTSSYLGGMPITAAMGEWNSGYGSGLRAENIIHIGARDLDDAEKDFIVKKKIKTFSKEQLESEADTLSDLVRGKPVYMHIDTDVYDPSEVVAEYSVDDGLFRHHIDSVLKLVLSEANLVGMEITELSPKTNSEREQSYTALFDSFRALRC